MAWPQVPLHAESPLTRGLKALHDQLTQRQPRSIGEVDTVSLVEVRRRRCR
jgi:hypothetical protein